MRLNVYAEEQTGEFTIIHKVADTGASFFGVRFFLKSPKELHARDDDDDRSAVTFWIRSAKLGYKDGDGDTPAAMFERVASALYNLRAKP